MPAVFTSRSLDSANGYFYWLQVVSGIDTAVSVALPPEVSTRTQRPWWAYYKRRIYCAGMFSKPLLFAEDYKLYTVGIAAPTTAPTLAAGAGTGLTGSYIGYYTYAHKIGSTLVHESSLSPGSATVALTNQNRSWTGFPTTSPDSRVNTIRFYVSVAGGLPKFVMEKTIGDTDTITENVGDDLLVEEGSTARGVPPYSLYMEPFHNRMFYVDPAHPDRLYFSELNEPESVDDLSWIATQGAETIMGIKVVRGQLIVFCRTSTYLVQGHDDDDLSMIRLSPVIGCVAPYSIVNINEVLYFIGERGIFTYDGGSFRYISADVYGPWALDYAADPGVYADAIGCENRFNSCYHLLIPTATGYRYVADYGLTAVDVNQKPRFSFFKRTRKDYVIGLVRGRMTTGSDEGYVRFEDEIDNTDDDGDAYQKKYVIQTRVEYDGDLGFEELSGKRWIEIDIFLKAELSGWQLRAFAGSDQVVFSNSPQYNTFVSLSHKDGYVAKSHHQFRPTALSGQGLMLLITAVNTSYLDYQFTGYGLSYIPGANMRLRT
jgi:hypothetical protein